ncbi:MAG: biotin--[Clostridia bacterium]|nr:biotin--[acetyl-CoA-carboxylase] ligase [Clostridia bacterium]
MKKLLINGIEIFDFEEASSTNTLARELGGHLSAVLAERQSGGRGRLSRSFFSPEGGLYMSAVLEPERVSCGLGFCTAAAALAVRDALEAHGVCNLRVKWVNDLLLDGRKVCGILTEAVSGIGGISRVIVGIGVNLREPEGGFPPEIADRAGYVTVDCDRYVLAADIAARLGAYVEREGSEIARLYGEAIDMIGRRVELCDYTRPGERIFATVLGVNENCFLRARDDRGEEITVSSGEIVGCPAGK